MLENEPAEQPVHVAASAWLNVPATQGVGDDEPIAQLEPAGQLVCDPEPAGHWRRRNKENIKYELGHAG